VIVIRCTSEAVMIVTRGRGGWRGWSRCNDCMKHFWTACRTKNDFLEVIFVFHGTS